MFLQTKRDYQEKLFEILNPLLPHYSDGKARLTLGYTGATYSADVAEMEGFARVLWGLAPYFYGGGTSQTFEEIYVQGLTHGSDPRDPEYWGEAEDYGQRLVEMAAIAVGLLLAPEKLWNPLSSTAKSNLASWLDQVNYKEVRDNNWMFFDVLVNVAFKKLGCKEYNEEKMNMYLSRINDLYIGNGWYQDGPSGQCDYYIAFAFHYYGLIYSVFMSDDDPTNAQAFKERADLFGKQFLYWFDEDGAGVPYGRSLTYRFAQVAFFSACVFAGVETLDLPVIKGIIDRNLSVWWHSHMQDFSGILQIGYEYPNLIMAEAYNAPGSPLWALKTFLLLALDDNHPYWQATVAEFPAVESVKLLAEAKMILLHRNRNAVLFPDGVVTLPTFVGHLEEKYSKFAYSSKFGFSVHNGNDCLENMAPDNELIFEIGGLFFAREKVFKGDVTGNRIVSHWSPFDGINVITELTVGDNSYYLKHTITSNIECTAYSCGFAISRDEKNFNASVADDCATIFAGNFGCEVWGGSGLIIDAAPNTNLLHPRTAIPAVRHTIGIGTTEISASVMMFP